VASEDATSGLTLIAGPLPRSRARLRSARSRRPD